MPDVIEFEISTTCSCVDEMDDGEFQPSQDCYGCWDDLLEMFNWDIYKPWLEANGLDDDSNILLSWTNKNWDRRSGNTQIPAGLLEDLGPLKLDGDFTLRFKLDGRELTATRSSHDEVGALFEFTPLGREN